MFNSTRISNAYVIAALLFRVILGVNATLSIDWFEYKNVPILFDFSLIFYNSAVLINHFFKRKLSRKAVIVSQTLYWVFIGAILLMNLITLHKISLDSDFHVIIMNILIILMEVVFPELVTEFTLTCATE